MFNLILHTALLVLAAFILGAIVGCLLRRFLAGGSVYAASSRSTPAQTGAAAATAAVAAKLGTDTQAEQQAKERAAAERRAAEERAEAEQAAAAQAAEKAAREKEAEEQAAKERAAEEQAAADAAAKTGAAAKQMDDAEAEAALAALPADASNEDKANAVGVRPDGLDAPIGGTKDNLQRIKGIGKVNERKLNDLGIYHFSQIKDWSPSEARWVGTFLAFAGRIEREDWIGQASVLAEGGETEFAKRVDKGDVETSASKKKK